MKVCLIASNCLDVSPYVQRYMDILKNNDIEFDVIEKRHVDDIMASSEESVVTFYYESAKTKIEKLLRFVKYALFVREKIKEKKYDKFILFSAFNSAICYFFVRAYIKGKYIVDIRDYDIAIELPIVNYLYRRVINEAKAVVVSSNKFKTWLPYNKEIYVAHNLPAENIEEKATNSFKKDVITIAYLGNIGYFEQNIKLINSLKNFSNVILKYQGRYPKEDILKDYCEKEVCKNVLFAGTFRNDEKKMLYDGVDFINALYGNDSLVVTSALPNKFYDCIYYKIPMIVSEGTYLGDIVTKFGIGIAIDIENDDVYAKIKNYIIDFDEKHFIDSCTKLVEDVKKEQFRTDNKILAFMQGEKNEN